MEFPTRFPDEIIINVLKYLNTYDLIRFCTAFENYDYFLREKEVNRYINLSGMFESHHVDICKTITKKLNYNFIKSLNVKSIYWIKAADWRNLIKKLENLTELYALDTALELRDVDISVYYNLSKLAVSAEDTCFLHATIIASKDLKKLKSLCIKLRQKMQDHTGASGMILFFSNLKTLEELWICDEDVSSIRINYERIALSLKNLNKFVIRSRTVIPLYDFAYIGLQRIFECRRSASEVEMIFERLKKPEVSELSIFEPMETDLEKVWDTFQSLHKDIPCGPKEGKLLFLKEDINNIYFEDLNFCHAIILCNPKYINAALQILSSKNVTQLKRLSSRSCLFQTLDEQNFEPTLDLVTKKPRFGIQYNPNHPFKKIADNIQGLTELEIYTCQSCYQNGVYSGYFMIHLFELLQKLTLEVPVILDGSFLKEVFLKCKQLQSVNFICVGTNEKFTLDLCNNIKYATALRDFRLDSRVIPIEKLLEGFNEIKNKKLLRLFLKCDNLRYTQENELEPFTEFMEDNRQLIFFFLMITKNTIKQNTIIQKTLNHYKNSNPVKIFFVKKEINSFSGVFPIPTAHHDMIFSRTNVSVVNVTDF